MKIKLLKIMSALAFLLVIQSIIPVEKCHGQWMKSVNAMPEIFDLRYDSITQTGVTVFWTTNIPADSKILWMAPDSNYQPLVFTDSMYVSGLVTHHVLPVGNLQPARIYKYRVISQNTGGTAVDSGYFVTRSESSGSVEVFFNHSVDTSVSTGENAKGNQVFENLFNEQINKATHSIDITLWEFHGIPSVTESLINAKNRGVKIRFIYNHMPDSSQIDSLTAHGIPVLQRNYLTNFSMHDKFWIFDHRFNSNHNNQFLWTGSTNVSHAMLHQDRNNVDADTIGGNKITATGSYNWETPAETGNDENLLVIQDARINNLYYQEFIERYHESGGMLVGMGNGAEEPWQSDGFSLNQNYPNPFATATGIRFTIAQTCRVKLSVYDMMGFEVQVLVNKMLKPGTYETSFDANSLTNGFYFYKISAGSYSETRKMMLKK
jgi:hypothetical protein